MSMSDAGSQSWLWSFRGRELDLRSKTLVMGILNVTEDSFSDGGKFLSPESAIAHAETLVADGADLIDIGAESSRPGSMVGPDAAAEEWQRLEPVLKAVRSAHPELIISVDTYRGDTALRALEAGADVINDIYALRHSPEIAGHCAAHDAG